MDPSILSERSLIEGGTVAPRTIDDMRTRLVDAAEEVIRERGIARATTREIARAAGCAEGTLYNHFSDKYALFVSVLTERVPAFVSLLKETAARPGHGTIRGNLERIATAAVAFFGDVIPVTATIFADPDLRERHRRALRRRGVGPQVAHGLVGEYIRGEQRLGRVGSRAKPETVGLLLLGGCYQVALLQHYLGEDDLPARPDRLVRDLVRTLVAGLEPEEG
jgi:AcrR family transcriptional regulator